MVDAVQKPQRRRVPFLKGAAILVALFLALIIATYLWLQSGFGRNFVESRIEATEIAGQSVRIDGMSGSILSDFSIDRLIVSDQDGDWLITNDVRVRWSPFALLGKTLSIEALEAESIDVLSRPILEASEDSEGALIERFQFQGIDLPDVDLVEPVLGRAMNLSLSGAVSHGPDGGEADLRAETDQGDQLVSDLEWSPLLVLSGTADVTGPPEGLLARLLRLNPGQSVSADISTEESQTTVLADIDGQRFVDALVERSQSTASVSGRLDPTRLPLLESVTPLLGGSVDFETVLPLDQDSPAQISIDAPKLQLSASGRRDDGRVLFDEIDLRATEPLEGIGPDDFTIEQLAFTGTGEWGEDYRASGTVQAQGVSYNDNRLDRLSGPVTLILRDQILQFETDLKGRASEGRLTVADGAALAATGEFDIAARELSFSQSTINLPGLRASGSGRIGFAASAPDLRFDGQYDLNTAAFRDGPSARLRGQADLRTVNGRQQMSLTGQATQFGNLPSSLNPILGEQIDYSAQLRFEEGRVLVPSFEARNETLTVNGEGNWSEGQLAADLDYSLQDYAYESVTASNISGTGTLSGPPSDLTIEADLRAETLQIGETQLTDATGTLSGTYRDGSLTGEAVVSGESDQGRLDAQSEVTWRDGSWSLGNIQGQLGEFQADGDLSGIGGDLASLRADLTLSGSTSLVPAETIDARVLLADRRVDIDATLEGVSTSIIREGTLRLVASGPREDITFQADLEGEARINEIDRPLTLSAQGQANLGEDILSVNADFETALSDLGLAGSTEIVRRDGSWTGAMDAQGLGGTLSAQLTDTESPELVFDVNQLAVSRLARLMARPVTEGTLSAEGRFGVINNQLSGQAFLLLENLRSPVSDSRPISVRSELSIQDEQLQAILQAVDGGLSGNASLAGPIQTSGQFPFIEYPLETPLQGRADLRGEIGPLVEIFLPPQTDFAGRIDTDVAFSLPYDLESLQGRVTLFRGIFEQGDIGLNLRDIVVEAELSGDTISVPTFSARDQGDGRLSGFGEMRLNDASAGVELRAEKLQVISRREGQAEMSGNLSLTRTSDLIRLSGELDVTDADINIARLPEPGLPTLDVNFGDRETEEETSNFASTLTELDIRIRSRGRVDVTGRGLDAALNLDARVVGAIDNPEITGEMSIERGRFNFLGKRFEFRDSSIILRDEIMQSVLALEAVRTTPDLTAVARVQGTFERPEIELTSEPTLPEDEVLSRILFGRSPTQLTALETARLAAALAQLSGGSGFDLFGSLESAIGLDTLDIGQSDTGQTQLTTGKYLSDDVYLEVRTAAEGTPSVAVEWQVRDNISVEAETVPNESERLSIQWKKDFD